MSKPDLPLWSIIVFFPAELDFIV